jgi:hypothetical protein
MKFIIFQLFSTNRSHSSFNVLVLFFKLSISSLNSSIVFVEEVHEDVNSHEEVNTHEDISSHEYHKDDHVSIKYKNRVIII